MASAKILIVEDEYITAKELKGVLEERGYCVTGIAKSGEGALQLAAQDPPDLALMDIRLGTSVDGIEAAHRLLESENIPIVFMTAYSDQDVIEKTKLAQPYGYLVKPVTPEQVGATVEMALFKFRMERKLEESEARYRGVVEDQEELICRFTPECVLTFVNGAYARYWEKTPEQMLGTNFLELIPVSAREAGLEHLRSFSKDQPVKRMEHEVIGPNGDIHWLQWLDRAFFNEEGRIVGFQSVGRDITHRVKAENALRASEERYRTLVEKAHEAVVVVDHNGVFLFMNQAAARQLGAHPDDFIGRTMWDAFPKEIADGQVQAIRAVIETRQGRLVEGETVLQGFRRWYRTSIQPLMTPEGNCRTVMLIASDITERKESEEQLDMALKGTRAGLWDWHVKTGKTLFNERWAEILGYTLEELQPISILTWMDLCHPEDLKESNRQLERHFSGEMDFYHCECRMRHKDGSWIWVLDRGRVMEWDEAGKPVRMIGTHVDITPRKRYETLIQAQRDMAQAWSKANTIRERLTTCLRSAIEVSEMACGGLYLVDESDGSLWLAVHSGLSESFINKASHHPGDSENARVVREGNPVYARPQELPKARRSALMSEGIRAVCVMPIFFHGRAIACLNVASCTTDIVPEHLRTALEAIVRYVGSFVAQALQEEKIRQNHADLETLFNTIQDMLFLLNSEGNIIHCNQMVSNRLGYGLDELAGQQVLFVYPEDRHEEVRPVMESMLAGECETCRIPLKTKNGSLIPVETKVVPGRWKGREVIIGISRDISERMEVERRMRQMEKAEGLRRMAGAVAHHFNNLLQVVIGNLELAKTDPPTGEGVDYGVKNALQAAHRAADMSSLMLAYTGFSKRRPRILDLSESCSQTLQRIQSNVPGHVQLFADFPSPGPFVHFDARQLDQVFTHLLTNALEAIGDEGEIRISIRTLKSEDLPRATVWPAEWTPGAARYAVLEVSDTGCGIPSEDMEKLMDPFFSTKFTGRGLGLAVSLGLVQVHGGCISVRSQVGVGSQFHVFLPLVEQEIVRPTREGLVAAQSPGTGLLILLVEDMEMLRNMAKQMLERLGYDVLAAGDGAEAVEIFQSRKDQIAVVLSDLTMPRMDGWQTLAALRKIRPDVPVVLSSGYDGASVMAGNHAEQPQVFLQKPYSSNDLKEALATALKGT